MAVSESQLYICPLCWKVVDGVGMLQYEVDGFSDCPYCKHEIIPLATPQVCRHSTEDDYKDASLYWDYYSSTDTTANADAFFVIT